MLSAQERAQLICDQRRKIARQYFELSRVYDNDGDQTRSDESREIAHRFLDSALAWKQAHNCR